MPTVSTNQIAAFTKSPYPPVFDGSKTIRPRSRKLCVAPPPLSSAEPLFAPSNDLEFSPAATVKTFRDLLAEAGELECMDTMHVNSFEKLMRSTNHNLLAVEPVAVKVPSTRCKQFLAAGSTKSSSISKQDFGKTREADELLCSVQGFFDFLNKLSLLMEGSLPMQTMRRKMKHQVC